MNLQNGDSPRPPVVVGLAGAIGAGKSTVANLLAGHGLLHIDFDKDVAVALTTAHVQAKLRERWGGVIFSSDGQLNKGALADRAFADDQERKALEAILHPVVWRTKAQAINEAIDAGATGALIDAPLLFEVGLDRECDKVLFVDAGYAVRLARVAETRGWDEAELSRREAAQWPPEEKKRRADIIISNTSTLAALTQQVAMVYSQIVGG